MPAFRLSCHDIFLGLAVFYAIAEILTAWSSFSSCTRPVHVWLIVGCLGLLSFRIIHLLTESAEEGAVDPWCFNLFTRRFKTLSTLIVGVLYPFFLVWTLLGTLWYAEVSDGYSCFKDEQQNWYFALWLVIFYIWIIGYNTAIIISLIIYCRGRHLEAEYISLVEQYGEMQPPDPNFSIYGLSPRAIQNFRVVEINTPMQGLKTCSVCQEDLVYGERARALTCGHMYHLACIDGWLMRKNWCPNCKQDLRREVVDEHHEHIV